jgi:hypothetical protein
LFVYRFKRVSPGNHRPVTRPAFFRRRTPASAKHCNCSLSAAGEGSLTGMRVRKLGLMKALCTPSVGRFTGWLRGEQFPRSRTSFSPPDFLTATNIPAASQHYANAPLSSLSGDDVVKFEQWTWAVLFAQQTWNGELEDLAQPYCSRMTLGDLDLDIVGCVR